MNSNRLTTPAPNAKSSITALALVLLGVSAQAQTPALWGVNEQQGSLFTMDDYTDAANTLTVFGKLKVNDNGAVIDIDKDIEAFTLDVNGVGWMALNRSIAGYQAPVLMRFDTALASTTQDNVVTIVGTMPVGFNDPFDNITGLAFHPQTGELYALFRTGNEVEDQLFIVDTMNGNVLQSFGNITGLGEVCARGSDLVFSPDGLSMYVIDDNDDHLYYVDSSTANILQVTDNNLAQGISNNLIKIEALAWDPQNNVLLAADDMHNQGVSITLQNGNNTHVFDAGALGLDDIEGFSFVPLVMGDCDGDGISDAHEIAAGAADIDGNGIPDVCESGVVVFCNGDGGNSVSQCPCGNNIAPGSIGGCSNASGFGAALTTSGSASVSANDLVMHIVGLPGSKPGILFSGGGMTAAGAGSPMLNGLRCIDGPYLRITKIAAPLAGSATVPVPGSPGIAVLVGANPGDTDYFQFWYRDPAGPCNSSANMTNALRVTWGM